MCFPCYICGYRRHRGCGTASCRHTQQRSEHVPSEHNDVPGAPGTISRARADIENRLDPRAARLDLHELPAREESDPTAIGRPEGGSRPHRASHFHRLRRVEHLNPERGHAVDTCGDEGDPPAVRRDREIVGHERMSRRRQQRRTQNRVGGRSRISIARQAERYRGDEARQRDAPGDGLAQVAARRDRCVRRILGARAQALQLQFHVMRCLPPFVGLFRETAAHDVVERLRREWLKRGNGWRIALQNRSDDTGGGFAVKGSPAGEHLVQHRAERKHIAAGVGLLSFDLLR